MINIVISEEYEELVNLDILEKTATEVLVQAKRESNVDVSIAIEDNSRIKELNHQFLGIDAPTDVLSFPSEETDPDTGNQYLGDIVISLPIATIQADVAGHPLQNELQLLVVHGMLHLLGYDHASAEMKTEMWSVQARILNDLSVQINKLPEE